MVKKLLSVFAMASLVFAASCTNEEFVGEENGNEATVRFNAQIPDGLQTRAYGDGTTAKTLSYAVYQVKNSTWTLLADLSKDDEAINMSKTVSFRLVNGSTYKIVFWADAQNSIYTFDKDNFRVTADYTGAANSDENMDAFYAVEEITVTGADSKTVELKRPFAQLNIGTGDLAEAKNGGCEVKKASVKINTYNTLNFKDGTVSGEGTVTFKAATLPTEAFPVTGYDYLTMNYLLMPVDKKADNTVTISYDGAAADRVFQNIPLQRNYRTNIYGNLLTSAESFNVVINPDFDGSHQSEVWDGVSVSEPQLDGDTYNISTAAEWVWLKHNGTGGKNLKLVADIDFGGYEVKGLGFTGTFDGQGYTMSNMVLLCGGSDYSNGLFQGDASYEMTVKNLTVKDVKAESSNPDQGYAGTIIGDVQNGNVTLENVNVIGADICGVQSVGGLVGFVASGKTLTVTNCSVSDSKIYNYAVDNESGFVAGLVGRPVGTVSVSGSEVKDTTIDGFWATRRTANSIAAVVGNKDNTGATVTDVTIIKKQIDAIVSKAAELTTALSSGKANIWLKAGDYELGAASITATNVLIAGLDKDNAKVNVSKSVYFADGSLTLDNLTLNVPTGLTYNEADFAFFHKANNLTVSNCNVNGSLRLNVANATVENCKFTVTAGSGFDGYALFCYGPGNATESVVSVKNSTFNTVKKGIVIYNESGGTFNLNVDDSQFTATTTDDKAAIQMHTEYGVTGTVKINNVTATGFIAKNNGVWNEVNNTTGVETNNFDIYVDGTKVHSKN